MKYKIKEATTHEVHITMRWDAKDEANDTGKPQLGEELAHHFADVHVAHNSYVWNHDEGEWTALSAAPNEDREEAKAARDKLFDDVRSKLADSKTAKPEDFLTYPNDDYVFYKRREDNSIDILMTGWGFTNYKPPFPPPPLPIDPVNTQDITFAFLDDGVAAPNRAFDFTTNQKLNHDTTDAEGKYHLKGVETGRELQVTDVLTRRTFTFDVEKGRTDYRFDVTRRADVIVSVREDGLPAVDENVTLTYGGKEFTAKTNDEGKAAFNVVYREEGGDATAAVRQEQQKFAPSEGTNNIAFSFYTPPPPPDDNHDEEPVVPTINVSVRDHNNQPFAGANVVFRQNGKELPAVLDETGTTHFPADTFATGVPVEALLTTPKHKYPAIPFVISAAECDYLLQEEATERPWWYTLLIVLGVVAFIVALVYIGIGNMVGIKELHNYFKI